MLNERMPDREPSENGPPPAPTWVKVSAIAVLILLITVVIVHLSGGGLGRHMRH